MLTNDDTHTYIKNSSKSKELTVLNSINKTAYVRNDNLKVTTNLCKERSEDNIITSIDFFKNSFWGEAIPRRKIDRVICENEAFRNK
jgi:hypothetical protein